MLVSSGDGGGKWFGPIGRILRGLLSSRFGRGRVLMMNALPTREDIEYLIGLMSSGDLTVSIERTCSLQDVPGEIEASEAAHTRGKVVGRARGAELKLAAIAERHGETTSLGLYVAPVHE